MIQAILVLALGFYVLVKGADWFVEGASSLACYFHIPQLVIGLTICAMGTSLPEASVSLVAAIHDNAQITIGNVVGSNILNVLIILGISSLITRLKIQKSTFLIEIPFIKNRPEPKFVVGDGAGLCYNYLLEQDVPCRMAPPQLVMQNAVGVALAAEEMAAAGQVTTARDLVPVYLRLSQAERERLARGLKITLD